jgi:hypothetical protein
LQVVKIVYWRRAVSDGFSQASHQVRRLTGKKKRSLSTCAEFLIPIMNELEQLDARSRATTTRVDEKKEPRGRLEASWLWPCANLDIVLCSSKCQAISAIDFSSLFNRPERARPFAQRLILQGPQIPFSSMHSLHSSRRHCIQSDDMPLSNFCVSQGEQSNILGILHSVSSFKLT